MGSICSVIMALVLCPLLCWYDRYGKLLLSKKSPVRSFFLRMLVFGVTCTMFVVFFLANFEMFSAELLKLLPKQFVDGSRKVLFAVFGTSSVFTALQSLAMLMGIFAIVATCTLSFVFGDVKGCILPFAQFVESVKTHIKGKTSPASGRKDNNIRSKLLI